MALHSVNRCRLGDRKMMFRMAYLNIESKKKGGDEVRLRWTICLALLVLVLSFVCFKMGVTPPIEALPSVR